MRPIDADKLLRKMQKVATEAWKMKMKAPNVETIWNQAIDYVKSAETIEQPEIIRCKDCRHWGRINQYENGTTDIDCKMGLSCDPNGFCHRAVQRGKQ